MRPIATSMLAAALLFGCDARGELEGDWTDDTASDADTDTDSDTDIDVDADTDADSDTSTYIEGTAYRCPESEICTQELCEQVLIYPGVFPMGDDDQPEGPLEALGYILEYGDESPQHDVYLDAFCIDRYEVSWQRYHVCTEADVCPEGCSPEDVATSHEPVSTVSPQTAAAYCEWIGRRLCTEAEWERAANGPGPGKQTYPWGEEPPDSTLINASDEIYEALFCDVEDYEDGVSAEGVYNLIGNVAEWVSDYYAEYDPPDDGPEENPTGPESGSLRIARGGAVYPPTTYRNSERLVTSSDGGGLTMY
jgi:formylglycine-generating enzyme required for sulfatase activity